MLVDDVDVDDGALDLANVLPREGIPIVAQTNEGSGSARHEHGREDGKHEAAMGAHLAAQAPEALPRGAGRRAGDWVVGEHGDYGRAELDLVTGTNARRLVRSLAVDEQATWRVEVDEVEGAAGSVCAHDLGVARRDVGIAESEVAFRAAPDQEVVAGVLDDLPAPGLDDDREAKWRQLSCPVQLPAARTIEAGYAAWISSCEARVVSARVRAHVRRIRHDRQHEFAVFMSFRWAVKDSNLRPWD